MTAKPARAYPGRWVLSALDVGYECQSCGALLDYASVDHDLVCVWCDVDCRCPPEGATAADPVMQLDDEYLDRSATRARVARQLRWVEWPDGGTVGVCASSFAGQRCERDRGHDGLHRGKGTEWR